MKHIRSWQLIALAVMLLCAAFLAPGVVYWNAIGAHAARCVYGSPECSLTVSTYALAFLTGGAFIAALRAATYAKEAVEHEKNAVIALNDCRREKGHKRTRMRFIVVHAATNAQFTEVQSPPPGGNWLVSDFDCHNVGRSAVIDGQLQVLVTPHATASSRRTVKRAISLGNMRPGKWVHAQLHIEVSLRHYEFAWCTAVHQQNQQLRLFTGTAKILGEPVTFAAEHPAAAPPPAPPPAPEPPR